MQRHLSPEARLYYHTHPVPYAESVDLVRFSKSYPRQSPMKHFISFFFPHIFTLTGKISNILITTATFCALSKSMETMQAKMNLEQLE